MHETFNTDRAIFAGECERRIENLKKLIVAQERRRDFVLCLQASGPEGIQEYLDKCTSQIVECRVDLLQWKIRESETI